DAERHQRFAEEGEERRVQVERAGGVAGVEVEVWHLAMRRAGDLVEDQPLVLEVDAVGKEAREVRRRQGTDRERGEAAAHSRPSRWATLSHHTIQRASRPTRRVSFDSPATRSTNRIPTPPTPRPPRHARWVVSIGKA